MTRLVIRIYDYLQSRRLLCYMFMAMIVAGSILLTLRLDFNEDISDFLPNDQTYSKSMNIYKKTNSADRIFVVFQMRDTSKTDVDRLIRAVETFNAKTAGEKWKTTAQMLALGGLLWRYNTAMEIIAIVLLYVAAILTIWSMLQYLNAAKDSLLEDLRE